MHRHGITIVEVIVILVVLAVIAALLLPNIVDAPCGGSKTHDISNLKNLVGIFISGQTAKKPTPKSMGHRFWLAMFVGDPAGTSVGLCIEDAYAQPSQAGNLLCPEDKTGVHSKDVITQAFEDAVTNSIQGWDKLPSNDNEYTSYAGPRNRRVFVDKDKNTIVGCDGSRDGIGFFTDGFGVVNASQGAQFLLYEDLARDNPQEWTGEEEAPNWSSTLLSTVINIEASTN